MSKKDLKFVGIIVAVAALICVIMLVVKLTSKPKELGIVQHGEEVILTFDIAKDATYDFEGDYGKMTLEVKDHKFRVIDVECPNHLCEQMGWIDSESLIPIVCLPNGIMVSSAME